MSVRPVAAPACGLALAGLADGPITVVDGGSGLAPDVVARLDAHGIAATVGDLPERDAWGVILLSGLAPVSDPEQAGSVSRAAFQAARTVAASMEERGGVFVTVQDTGGCFGLKDPDPQRAWLGGLAALTRTAAKEWRLAAVKAIDCQRGDRGNADGSGGDRRRTAGGRVHPRRRPARRRYPMDPGRQRARACTRARAAPRPGPRGLRRRPRGHRGRTASP